MGNIISLRNMKVGETGRIARVDAKGEVNQRIRDMGLIPGASITIVGKAPLRDPVALRLFGVTITLRNQEADFIQIELPETATA